MEWARLCHTDDIKSCLDESGITVDEDTFNEIVDDYSEMLWQHEQDIRDNCAIEAVKHWVYPLLIEEHKS